MLEYFIATPGARKGLVDTALRTADSGYLTRRLVDVAQELIINEDDPVRQATTAPRPSRHLDREHRARPARSSAPTSRPGSTAGSWPTTSSCRTAPCWPSGSTVARGRARACSATIRPSPGCGCCRRSPTTPSIGISAASYGLSLATGKTIEIGEAVGVIAAQSIGEPGTQLTMRTFHTGGIAGAGDIAGGLPRVVELFEARSPKGKATLARISGVVRIADDEGKGRVITIVADDGTEDVYTVPGLGPPRGHRRPGDPGRRSPSSRVPAIPRSCSRSRASARPSSTSSTRSRRSTATRACRSTTSTSS